MLVLLAIVYDIQAVFAFFLPDENISPCYGLHCSNSGTLVSESCSCLCADGYQGLLCETEIKQSPWPDGSYSLLSTVFGCPEPGDRGWKPGYVNLTVSAGTEFRQWFPEKFRLLGPYHLHTIQLNFCTRTADRSDPVSNRTWPRGSYCIFKVEEEDCSQGFTESSLPLKDYSVWEDDIGGVVPDVNISDDGITLTLCCKEDGENGTAIDLPTVFPFYLLKPLSHNPCQDVTAMVITEEDFSFVKTTNRTWLGREGSFTVEESDLYFNLTLCYYEPYERWECMYGEDYGTSYRGRMNVTADGRPCWRWTDFDFSRFHNNDEHDIFDLSFEGDYDQNYCRHLWGKMWEKEHGPFCVVDYEKQFCSISICDQSDNFPNIIKGKVYRSAPTLPATPVQEIYDVSSDGLPHVNRRIVTYVSKHQWDFLRFGAYTCNGPFNPPRTKAFRFQCRRPLIGSFVTVQNFVRYDPSFNTDLDRRLEVSHLTIRGKATGCGKSLGIKSGDVQDFQFTSSVEGKGHNYAYHSRLNRKTGWCSRQGDTRGFIQVDLLTPMVVQGIVIQGWTDGRDALLPVNFTVTYGNQENNLTSYVNSLGKTKVFRVDQTLAPSAPQKFMLPYDLLTRIVRIELYQETSPVCAKFDFLGCPKRLEFDLKCKNGSERYGFQILQGHHFNDYDDYRKYEKFFLTLDRCRSRYDPHTEAAYIYDQSEGSCSYMYVHRYQRQRQHRWESGYSMDTQYGQLMCVKDIVDAYKCGGPVRSKGVIVSPSYPFYYGENVNCIWSISLKEGSFVSLTVIDISLATKEEAYDESAYFECEDSLTIYDGKRHDNKIIAMVTQPFGILEGPRYISSTNEIEINLISCHRVQETSARGFKIMVGIADCAGCGQGPASCVTKATCTDECGYISSTNFPNYYPVLSSCQWRIQGHMGQYVTVTFDMIDVYGDAKCERDSVTLYDLDLSDQRSLIGQFCKFQRPFENIESSWHMMDVEFYSDFGKSGKGFRLKYVLRTIQLNSTFQSSAVSNGTWYEYDLGWYKFITDSDGLSWVDAEIKCKKDGGHLVSINHPEEMLFLLATILNNNLFAEQESYIGLRKLSTGGFQWTDGKSLTLTEWYGGDATTPSQPDGFDKEACTVMKIAGVKSTANWHDVACAFSQVKQYICERERNVSSSLETAERQVASQYNGSAKEGYYFGCSCGEHVSSLYVCDGKLDCYDGSDEDNCTKVPCPRGMFPCSDGGCVDIAFYCDHRPHCQDGSDEDNCVFRECSVHQWKCTSGQCVAREERCDLIEHCVDKSDEENCRESCRKPFFQCYDGQCLPRARVCDGFVDCEGQYREDEGTQCTTNSQPSCSAWHALGARQNGRYNINKDGSSESFPIECIFDKTQGMVTTEIHHTLEDRTVTGNHIFYQHINYSVPHDIIQYIKSTSSTCRQRVHIDCLHACHIVNANSQWIDAKGRERSFKAEPGSSCSCILRDSCSDVKSRCACDQAQGDFLSMDDDEFLTDSGYIDDMESLPIITFGVWALANLRRVRHSIGPLICEEPIQTTSMSILCKSGAVVDVAHKCILDYDIYHYHTGCRDLTHIQDCEDFQCPTDHIKCPSSFCIPLRLVCDGHRDCADGMDERGCFNMTCPERFRCHGNRICIPWRQVCDDIKQCPEADDEMFCNTTCPDACICKGSYVSCNSLTLNDTEVLPQHTKVLDMSRSINTTILTNNSFYHLENLAVLNLSYIGLYELETEVFNGLQNLLYLDLRMNHLVEIPQALFQGLNNLRFLSLRGNDIFRMYLGSFEGLSMLPSLDLSDLALTDLRENVFQGLVNLKFLNLSGNAITGVANGAFRGLTHLETLDLRKNAIKDFTEEIFTDLARLTHIYNDKYAFCCFRPASVPQDQCLPQADEFSSCSDLMRNEALRISLWTLGFIALAGNTITILFRYIYDKQSLHRSNDLFVANLALSDFFMGVYMIMIASADVYYRGVYSLNDDAWRGSWICQLAGFLATLSSETSVMFLCMITLERVIIIRFPFRDFNHWIQRFSRCICLVAWCLGILFAGIPLLPMSYFSGSFYSRSGVCLALPLTRNRPPGWEYSTAIFVFWNFICFAFIALAQTVIFHTVKESQRIRRGRTTNDMVIARKLSFIVLTDFVCWFPICVMGLMALQGHVIGSEVYAWVAVFVLPINSALNPIIYTLSAAGTIRQRKMKRTRTISNTHHSFGIISKPLSTFLALVKVRNNCTVSKKMYVSVTKPADSRCLSAQMRSITSVRDLLAIVYKLAVSLDRLHAEGMVCGEVDTDTIYVIVGNDAVTSVTLSYNPMAAETVELSKDILDFGHLISKMLRAYTVSKAELY